jgi:hypothetical protein
MSWRVFLSPSPLAKKRGTPEKYSDAKNNTKYSTPNRNISQGDSP